MLRFLNIIIKKKNYISTPKVQWNQKQSNHSLHACDTNAQLWLVRVWSKKNPCCESFTPVSQNAWLTQEEFWGGSERGKSQQTAESTCFLLLKSSSGTPMGKYLTQSILWMVNWGHDFSEVVEPSLAPYFNVSQSAVQYFYSLRHTSFPGPTWPSSIFCLP